MGLFGKKKKGTPPPCCGRTPETAVRVGADKTAASVKVLGQVQRPGSGRPCGFGGAWGGCRH